MSSVQGRRVWLTGASAGIGEALATELAQQGAQLVLSARRRERLEALQARLPRPDEHRCLDFDLSDEAQRERACDTLLAESPPAILINNGGISQRALAADTGLDVDRRIMEINYFAAIHLTKRCLPYMIEAGHGQVVFINSVAGKVGTPLRSAYAASKHALTGFTECLRPEVRPQGVSVLAVHPGFVRTEISKNALSGDGSQHGVLDDAQAKAMLPETCARGIVRAMHSGRDELLIGGRELNAIRLQRWSPSLWRWMVQRIKVT